MPVIVPSTVLRVHPDVVWREIDDEMVLLNVATGLYYGLDTVGGAVWRLFVAAPTSVEAVRDAMLAQYTADASTIERDIVELATRLVDAQLLQIST